jgi:hypothetical protein
MRTVYFARQTHWPFERAAKFSRGESKIGIDRGYLLCYSVVCIRARRIAGPFFPPEADSTTSVRIPILEG